MSSKFFARCMASFTASSDRVFELQLASHPIIGRSNASATDSASAYTTRGVFLSSCARRWRGSRRTTRMCFLD
jgi:hypothetical protein